MENKSIEEIANSQKNFLSTKEVAAVLGISPLTFRRRVEEYAELFPIERVGRIYRIPKEPFIAYVRTGKAHKYGSFIDGKTVGKMMKEYVMDMTIP